MTIEAFRDATANLYRYLFIDMKPKTPDAFRLKCHVLDSQQVVYVSKKYKKSLQNGEVITRRGVESVGIGKYGLASSTTDSVHIV